MWLNGFNDNVPGYPKVECEMVSCPKPYMGDDQPGELYFNLKLRFIIYLSSSLLNVSSVEDNTLSDQNGIISM